MELKIVLVLILLIFEFKPSFAQNGFISIPNQYGHFNGRQSNLSPRVTRSLFPSSGVCEKGRKYRITQPSDFYNHGMELECVFQAGLVPEKVPLGSFYGTRLTYIAPLGILLDTIWKSKLITKTDCGDGNDTYIGWNNLMGSPKKPCIVEIKRLDFNLAPGECNDGKEYIITDCTQELDLLCPNYWKYDYATFRRQILDVLFPMRKNVEVFRFVGRQEDTGSIYLGKKMFINFYGEDQEAVTADYFYFVNYDPEILPGFEPETALPATTKRFTFKLPSLMDTIRISPQFNLLTNPIRTSMTFYQSVIATFSKIARVFGE